MGEKNNHKLDKFMSGKMIEPLKIQGNEKVSDFISNVFGYSGFNARRLAKACDVYKKMIESDSTICLTLSGAMTPIGMSGPIIQMMEMGFIDFIISTGANLYHDLHRPFDYPMRQGEILVDDRELESCGISRIYDTYISDDETLIATDSIILETLKDIPLKKPISTAHFHNLLGKRVLSTAPHPEKSLLAQAARLNIPIYTSAPGDSSIGMNLSGAAMRGKHVYLDPLMDIAETTAIVMGAKKNGAVEIGGGSPKNFYMQTQPQLWQILKVNKGGHDFFIQLTVDSPQWGGLSGATPNEAISWGKIKKDCEDSAVVYSCASITYPLLCQFVRQTCKPRKNKELYLKRKELVNNLNDEVKVLPEYKNEFKKIFGKEPNTDLEFYK